VVPESRGAFILGRFGRDAGRWRAISLIAHGINVMGRSCYYSSREDIFKADRNYSTCASGGPAGS